MDGAARHDEYLLTLFTRLNATPDRLLRELTEVDRDLHAVWRTASLELRARQAAASAAAEAQPIPGRTTSPPRHPFPSLCPPSLPDADVARVPSTAGQPGGMDGDAPQSASSDAPARPDGEGPVLMRKRGRLPGKAVPPPPDKLGALATLGPVRDDRALPAAVDADGQRLGVAGIPTGGVDLVAARAAVQAVAARARQAPPGKGGRRHMSSRGLVPGEPMMPALRNVLRAADRPLTSLEAALALLEMRGLTYEGPELVAVVNRVSALFGQEVAKGNMRRVRQEGTRANRWELVMKEPPLDAKAHMRGGANTQPKGSTG